MLLQNRRAEKKKKKRKEERKVDCISLVFFQSLSFHLHLHFCVCLIPLFCISPAAILVKKNIYIYILSHRQIDIFIYLYEFYPESCKKKKRCKTNIHSSLTGFFLSVFLSAFFGEHCCQQGGVPFFLFLFLFVCFCLHVLAEYFKQPRSRSPSRQMRASWRERSHVHEQASKRTRNLRD